MNKNNKIIIAAIAVVALLLVIGALFASGILSGNDDDKNTASYEVSFIDGDDVIKTLNIKENSLVSRISDPEKEGYIFTGWYSDKELTNEFDFENILITKNTNIYAKWVKASEPEPGDITFTVTFNTDGASSIASQTVKEGEKAVKPADPLKSGYKFEGWYSDSSFTTKFDFKTPITFDITLYAKFTASQGGGGGGGSITPPPVTPDKTYSIIYNGNSNNSGTVPDTQILSKNNSNVQISTQNSLLRDRYTFVCWNTEKDGTGTNYVAGSNISFNDLNSDLTLYAKWIIGTYDVEGNIASISIDTTNTDLIDELVSKNIIDLADTSNYENVNTVNISKDLLSNIQKENENNKKDISVKTAKGSVQLSSNVVDSIISTNSEDISIKIDSESNSETKYSIEITSGGNPIDKFPEAIKISIPYTLKDGENPQDIVVYYIDDKDDKHLVHGTYNEKTKCVDILTNHLSTYEIRNDAKYSISFILNGGKFESFTSSNYVGQEFNKIIPKPADPLKAGYAFKGWFKDESLTTAWNFDIDTVKTLDESNPYTINLYAKWEAVSYNIAYILDGGINSSGNPTSYTIESETITPENPTKTDYTFKGWFTDEEFTNQITSIINGSFGDVALYASWEKNKYSVTLSSGTGYKLNQLQNPSIVEHGGSFQFTLSINDDFKQSTPVVISNGETIPAVNEIYTISNITENQIVTVEGIKTNSYSITFANKDGFYDVDNSNQVNEGENFTFTITLSDAYSQSILTESSVKVFGICGGISKTGENVNQYTITNVTSDLVVFVDGLKKNEYVVTFISDSNIILDQKVSHGDSAALISNLTKPGYKFKGWYLDDDGNTKYSNEAITEDTTLYAKWNAGTTNYFIYIYQEKISYTENASTMQKYELIKVEQLSGTINDNVSVNYQDYLTGDILGSTNGFNFNKSISNTGGVISTEDPLILKLYFDRKEFIMTFKAPEGSQFESVSEIKAKYGQPVSPIRVTLPDGYTLDHWYESDEKIPYLFTTMPDHDVTLHSKFTKIYYLEYNANGGIGDLPYKIGYINGTNVTLFGPNYPTSGSYILTKEGYTFGGWKYGDETYQPSESFTMPNNDVTLIAVWKPITYNVHFDGNESTSGSMTDQTFTYDVAQDLTVNAFVKTGYNFLGWSETLNGPVKYADNQSVNNLASSEGATVTIYAVWQINQYTIIFNSNGGSAVESITSDYQASVTLPSPIKEGHTFAGWYSDESLNTKYTSDKISAEDITLYAKWTTNSYNVTFHCNNESNDTTASVEFNTSITEPTNVSKLGYTLEGWYSDSSFNTKWNFTSDKMPSHDVNLYAKWTATSYTVNFYNGIELVNSTTYTVESDSIQMPSNPSKTGYTFNGWFDSTLTNAFSYVKGTTVGDLNLYAKFTINQYKITFNSNGGSAVVSIIDDYNASVTLPTPTNEGYTFDGWYLDESLDTKYTSDKVPAENITLYAKWTKNSYTLTINYVYEDGSKAHDPYVESVVYGETYLVISPSIESLLPNIPTVTGTMPANNLTITVTYGDHLVSINGNNYRTIEDALASAQEGDRLILLRDYTIQKDLTIPKGILLVLPCSDDDAGYDLTAEYEKEHNPDGITKGTEKCDHLYRTLTVSSNATLTVEGQLLVNAVTGRAEGGYRVMDITGGYAQILLEGNIIVKNEGILEVCGYITGSGQITAESGAEVREMYIVQHWRGGSQALAIYPDLFPFNEYDCHSIQSNLTLKSGASLFGNVKMYETWYESYHYTRFPQIDTENGMIRLLDGAYLTMSHDSDEINGTNSSDKGRTHIDIYGGATFSHSTLEIVGLELSTKDFIYPIDGDISFGLHNGEYTLENNFKLLTGGQIILYENASLSLNEGNTLVLYDEFNDIDNTSTTEYPDRPAALLILYDGSIFNIYGTFAGIISFADSGIATVNDENAEALVIDTKEVSGYVGNDSPSEVSAHGYVTLHFETKYQYSVTFETNGGSELAPLKYFLSDYLEDIPEPVKTGFNFEGWYLDSNLTQKYNYDALTGNTTLYAKWEDSKYTVSFETNRGSSVASQEILYNNTVTKPSDPTRSGYIFEGWYSDAALTSEYDFNTLVTENITLYAKWTAVKYTISFVTNNGETLDSITYTADDASLNIQKLSKTGYTFEKWCIDKELTTGFEFKQYETYGDLTLYAKWVSIVYTIKYYDGTQLNLTPASYTIEDSITLPTATKSGYEFAGWHENSDLSGDAIFSINEGTTGNKEYYASWTETVYSITYMDGETKIENLSPASYITTKRTELPTPTKEGYTFNGWYNNTGLTDKALSIPIGSTGDKTFYASFTINPYKITFNSNGGSEVNSIEQNYGTAVTKPTPDPTKTGYKFEGWFKDNETFSEEWNFEADTMPVDGTTLFAKWTPITYSVIFNENGGMGSMENQSFIYDETESLNDNVFTRTGYTFMGWSLSQNAADAAYTNGQELNNLAFIDGDEVTLYAVWQINQYKITFNSNGGSAVESITADYNSVVSKPADPTKEGYTFAGWFKDNESFLQEWNFEADTMPVDGTVLFAKWQINQYKITFNSNGGSAVTSIEANYNATITEPSAPTKTGYIFAGWYKDEDLTNAWNFETDTMPVDGTTLFAKWTANSYNVKYYVDSETIFNETVAYGTSVPTPADPTKKGHTFKDWGAEIPSTMPANDLEFHAIFEINKYTITYVIDGTAVQTQTYEYGATISPYQPEKQEGKTFSGWSPALPDTMPDQNITVSGSFDANTFTITYYVDGVQYRVPQSVTFGETVTPIDAPTKEGYSFSGWDWNGNEEGLGTAPQTMPAEHLSVDGYFTINSYKVTFHYNNGDNDTTEPIAFNSLIAEPTNVSKLGYTLDSWYSDSNFNTKWNFTSDKMPAKDIILYAKWDINSYEITFNSNGGSDVKPIEQNYGAVVSKPIDPTKAGYTFAGWFKDNESFLQEWNFETDTTPVDGITLYARWTANSYTVIFNANGATGSMESQDFTYDETKKLAANSFENKGYTFLGWSLDKDAAEATYTNSQEVNNLASENNAEVTLYAVWKINQYTITFNSNEGSAVDPITTDYNAAVSKPTDPTKEGYSFAGWYSNTELTAEYTFTTMPAEDNTLYAKWDVNQYKITFHYNNGSEDTTTSVEFNTSITEPTSVSKSGYTLEGWYSDSSFSSGTKWDFASNKMLSHDVELYANWTLLEYTITFNLNGGPGPIADMQYNVEKSITLPAPNWDGYVFDGWYENDTKFEYVSGQTFGNHTLVAKWTAETYKITYMDGSSEITAESGWPITYTSESATPLPTSATKTGYTFAGWYNNSELSGNTVPSIPAQSIGDKIFYAKWTPITYTVIFDANGGTGNMGNQPFTYDTSKSLSENAFTKDYHSFMGWSLTADGDVRYSNSEAVSNLTSDKDGQVTLFAVWTPTKYKITYELGGGINSPENSSEYTYADKIKILPPTKEGYYVSSWTISLADGTTIQKSMGEGAPLNITNNGSHLQVLADGGKTTFDYGDITLTANWKIKQYTITFNSNGGSEVGPITADYNTDVTLPTPTKGGYTFAGWYSDESLNTQYTSDKMPADNITLYAGWASGTNTVTLPSGSVSGYAFTAAASSGYDPNDVQSGNDFVFDITFTTDIGNHVPVISYGDNVKGPDSRSGSTYQFTIPNVTTSLSVELGLSDTTSLINLVNNTNSSDYKLSFDGNWTLTVEISNPSATNSKLMESISDAIGSQVPVNPNSGRAVTNFLAYLPDDDMLWENNLAEYIADIAGYKIIFKQDADAIEEAKIRYLTEIAQAVRVFRDNPDYYPMIISNGSYSEIFSVSAGVENENYKFIDIGVLVTYDSNKSSQLTLDKALLTNYATVTSLVGHEDALWGRYDLNADFSNAMLNDPVDLSVDLLDTADIQTLYRVALAILKDMQMPIDSAFSPINNCFNNGVGYGGYGKYYCASVENGIRYTDIYHIKFTNYFEESKPTSHTISFTGDIANEIALQNFTTYNSLANITFDAHNKKNHVLSEDGGFKVIFNKNTNETDIYKYELSRLAAGELIVININQNSKLTMSDISVTTSSGANVEWYNSNSFIMPDGDVTISLKKEQVEVPNIISQPQSVSISQGQSAELSISASTSDNGLLSYAWYKGTSVTDNIAEESKKVGITETTYSLPADLTAGSHYYFCVVTNTLNGSNAVKVSSIATVTVLGAYTLSLDANGGTLGDAWVEGLSISETAKLSDVLPIPQKFGFSFSGWYEDTDLTMQHPLNMPSYNLTLYAKWSNALSPDGSVSAFENGTDYPWQLDTSSSDFIYESSNYNIDSSNSQFSATVSGAGKLYFMYSVSSEGRYDKLSVTLDGQETTHVYSGEVPWTLGCLDIVGEEDHIITWTYSKDSSNLKGDDKARIKELSFIPEGYIKNLNVDINVDLPEGYDGSLFSIAGLSLGSNTLQAGTESTVTVSYEGLVFIGWKNENGSWLLGDGVNECTENTLSYTALHDSSLTAVFVINEPILPDITISQDGQEGVTVTDGMELAHSYSEESSPVFTFDLAAKYSDVNVAISLNGTDVAYSGNTCVLQNITDNSELVFTAVRAGYLTQTLTLYFKPILLISDICTDGSVTSVYSSGDYKWSLDSTIPNRTAYKSNNQLINKSLSSLAVEVIGPGILCFDYCVSSESKYDSLLYNINQEITLDNKDTATNYDLRSNYSGDTGWTSETIIISAADSEKTTIYFAYCKDGSGEKGQDTAWISNVRFIQGSKTITFNEPDQSAGTISGKYNQLELTFGENEISTGTEISLKAEPAAGYYFYGWSDNGSLISLSDSCSFTVLDDMSINAVFALENTYAARNGGTWYTSLEEALNAAETGDRIVLLKDYTITQDLTIPQGVTLVLPCSNEDNGYDLTAAYESVHNPDGTSTNKADISVLYRTLTIPSDVTLTIEGQVLVNAVTGRPAAGHYDMDVTGNYSQILLDGNTLVENGAILEVCGYIKGDGQVTAKNGSDIRDIYVVKNWRGGSQASSMYFKDIFPFNEYDCNNIQCTLYMEASASLSGNVKMYASGSYHYTRFPQINQANGLIRLADGAHLIKTYDAAASNGTSVTDIGRTTIRIYGGSSFSSSTLNIVGMDLSTGAFIYPVDGDISLELHSGAYTFTNNFKFMTGASMTICEDATLTLPEGKTVVFYDEFVDVDNTSTTEYPERPSAVLLLKGNSEFTLNGTFAGIVKYETSTNQVCIGSTAVTASVTTNEANGYQKGTRELSFDLQTQQITA